jgi:hypothetical protein
LLSLVNDILDAAALQHQRLVLARSRVLLRPLVEEVADISRPLVGVMLLCLIQLVYFHCEWSALTLSLVGGLTSAGHW